MEALCVYSSFDKLLLGHMQTLSDKRKPWVSHSMLKKNPPYPICFD